jgi:DNA-binding NarL/FixJ family response regulator
VEIGQEMSLAPKTVRNHVSTILAKLVVHQTAFDE